LRTARPFRTSSKRLTSTTGFAGVELGNTPRQVFPSRGRSGSKRGYISAAAGVTATARTNGANTFDETKSLLGLLLPSYGTAPDPERLGEPSPDAGQPEPALPTPLFEEGAQRTSSQLGLVRHAKRLGPRPFQQLTVADQAADTEGRHPRLARTEEVTRPSDIEVLLRDQEAVFLPPWILEQSPAGSSTKDFVSRALVAWPAQECAPSAQSFLATALMP